MSDQNAITPDGQVKRDQSQPRENSRKSEQSEYSTRPITAASLALEFIDGDDEARSTIQQYIDTCDGEFQRDFLQFANNPKSIPRDTRKITTWTVNDLLDAKFSDPLWTVQNMIPIGLGSLAGKPKVGKSWLTLQLSKAKASGGHFLGVKVEQSPVIYLAYEDSPRRLKKRIEVMGIERDTPITFHTEYPLLNAGGLDKLYQEIQSTKAKLIIIDTFGRSVGRHEIKDYSENVGLLSPLQSMAQELAVTILLVDHHGKMTTGDNPIVDLIGSIGKAATFDCVMGLYKQQGVAGGKLMIISRDAEQQEIALEWDSVTCTWQAMGDVRSYFQQSVLDAIFDLTTRGEPATTRRISLHLDSDQGQVSRAISNLINIGKVGKLPKIGVEQPYEVIE